MMPSDVFISYRRKDKERVLPLVRALEAESVSVWLDQSEINEFAPITAEIRTGLSECKALLAWYSSEYPKSRACQMELTAAFIAGQREGEPRHRVLVVNLVILPRFDEHQVTQSRGCTLHRPVFDSRSTNACADDYRSLRSNQRR